MKALRKNAGESCELVANFCNGRFFNQSFHNSIETTIEMVQAFLADVFKQPQRVNIRTIIPAGCRTWAITANKTGYWSNFSMIFVKSSRTPSMRPQVNYATSQETSIT
jgi:hypothetical protein